MITNLTDLPTLLAWLTINSQKPPQNSSVILLRQIASQSAAFYNAINRNYLESSAYTEVRDGQGREFMQIMEYPLTGITSLQIDSCLSSPSTAWNQRGYQFDSNGKITLICDCFPRGRRNILFSGTVGYAPIPVVNELQVIPGSTTTYYPFGEYQLQAAQPNWRGDNGVTYFSSGTPLAAVNTAPAVGQYFVQNGLYLFNEADAGGSVLLNYSRAGFPDDITEAVTEMTALEYKRRSNIDLRTENAAGMSTTYFKNKWPDKVNDTISFYRRKYSLPGI